jgi:hypothetical protein
MELEAIWRFALTRILRAARLRPPCEKQEVTVGYLWEPVWP